MKWLLIILFIVPSIFAVSISDWPDMFITDNKFYAKYVVGDEAPALDVVSATVISTSLARYENVTTEVGTSTIDSEISNISLFNSIVIGSPCELKSAYLLLGNPEPCYKDLAGGIGYIMVFEKNGRKQLLITGLDEKDRNAAAKFLAEKSVDDIDAKTYLVQSHSGSVPPLFNKNITGNTTYSDKIENSHQQEIESIIKNATNIVNTVKKNITVNKNVSKEYQPIKEISKKKKGFFGRIWAWLSSLFK